MRSWPGLTMQQLLGHLHSTHIILHCSCHMEAATRRHV